MDFEQMAEQADSQPAEEPQAETPEQNTEQPEQRPGKDHPGYAPVDLDDVPDDKRKAIEDRFGYFFKQDKARERELKEFRDIAAAQSQRIEELTSGVGQVVDHLHNQSTSQKESQLEIQMQNAFDAGDNQAYVKAQTELIALRVQKANQPKEQPKQQAQQPKMPASAQEIASELSYEDQQFVASFQSERDESGQPLRPWAVNKSNNPDRPDPEFIRALLVANEIFEDNPHRSHQENLMELDRRMGTKTRTTSQAVLGGNLTTRTKGAKLALTPEQQDIARRLRVGGKKASGEEHLAAYRAQLEKSRAKGGR